jgi:hypothetical protein
VLVDFNGRKLEVAALPHAADSDGLEAVLWHVLCQLRRLPGRFRVVPWKRLARILLDAAIIRAAPALRYIWARSFPCLRSASRASRFWPRAPGHRRMRVPWRR